MSTFHTLKAELPNGSQLEFEQLKGKVVLVVNVASKWYVISNDRFDLQKLKIVDVLQRIYPSVQGPPGSV